MVVIITAAEQEERGRGREREREVGGEDRSKKEREKDRDKPERSVHLTFILPCILWKSLKIIYLIGSANSLHST